ncbi:MAG TPA: hypothetical protein PLA87_09605 [Pseudomonadota bacterium]|nr:hypothetical protein [Deltaproteobacteria bacterium]HPH27089.1 hypothetical protein [Pseudomonadota bacterium]
MNLVFTKHVLLALGIGVFAAACDNTDPGTSGNTSGWVDIQADIKSLGCAAVGCHSTGTANGFAIDTTAGKEQANYDALLATMLINKSAPEMSRLIVIGKGGMPRTGTPHPAALSSTKATVWTTWIQAGAPFAKP